MGGFLRGQLTVAAIVGKGAGLHPLVVLLALIVGAQFGLDGIVIAVPLASLMRVLVRELHWLPLEKDEVLRPPHFQSKLLRP